MTDRADVEKTFSGELSAFEAPDSGILDFTIQAAAALPDYFLMPTAEGGDNRIVSHTKAAFAFADTLLKIEQNQARFFVGNRDSIRSAIILHDGMIYGDGKEMRVRHEHPELMACFLRSTYWDNVYPRFLRDTVIGAVETHSGEWVKAGNAKVVLRKPETELEKFVHMCVYLASRKATTLFLPGTEAYYRKRFQQGNANGIGFDTALSIVRQMVSGRQWDGIVYQAGAFYYTLIDGQQVTVAYELLDAFLTVGQAHISGAGWGRQVR